MKTILGAVLMFVAQLIIFYQLYGPLKYQWLNNNKWFLYLMSIPIAFLLINATKMCAEGLGSNWSARFMTQVAGVLAFLLANWLTFGEGLNTKNIICLVLGVGIIGVQLFWK